MLISQGIPQLGGEMAKTSLHSHTAVARLPGVSSAFLSYVPKITRSQAVARIADHTAKIVEGHVT